MKDTIAGYNKEVDLIERVLNSLVGTQNSSVFDKLCIKCNTLFNKMAVHKPKELSLEEIKDLIAVLKRLLKDMLTLSMYKSYLISVINENYIALQQEEQKREAISTQDTAPALKAEEVSLDEVAETKTNDVKKLEFIKPDLRDAA